MFEPRHAAIPVLNFFVPRRELVVPGVKKIPQHSEQVEVHKPRTFINQKRLVRQHFLKGEQALFQSPEQISLLLAPLIETAAAELSLLVPHKQQPVGLGDEFAPVNVRELECTTLNVVLDVAPEDGLHALQSAREQPKRELLVQILGDDLRLR